MWLSKSFGRYANLENNTDDDGDGDDDPCKNALHMEMRSSMGPFHKALEKMRELWPCDSLFAYAGTNWVITVSADGLGPKGARTTTGISP